MSFQRSVEGQLDYSVCHYGQSKLNFRGPEQDIGDDYMASVEFSGMIREEPSAGPSPFREVWNMTKPKSGRSGWLVAGVQALQ